MAVIVKDKRVGHTYKPTWLDIEADVLEVSSKGAVHVEFVSGNMRWFRPREFKEDFVHQVNSCIICAGKDLLKET